MRSIVKRNEAEAYEAYREARFDRMSVVNKHMHWESRLNFTL